MNNLKYIVFLYIGISLYSCGTTKAVIKEDAKEETTVTETNTEDVEIIEIDETELDVEETVLSEKEIEEMNEASKEVKATKVELDEPTSTSTNAIRARVNHSAWNELLQKHVSEQGNVNYKGFKEDKTVFYAYLDLLSEIPPQDSWSKDETLAYWMNVYNAFTVKLILDNYPTKSIKDISGPWSHRFIRIGEKWYTLNDVEHRIIRKMDEPRIHFALVCAAVSCPRLYNKAFTEKDLEADLDLLTRGFLSDTSKNELSENSIKLSRIFKWYGGDFKSKGKTLIDFLNQYSDVKISAKAKKSYKDYNWSLNE
ncbi:DUF547 domain-containing protein [uncultured Psychroserpens sp.]|uniref:DUF547 domain-containing protein n=1 Tax=uncultured Psychroserpens sp. TaxID=255436 RepID=UPI00263990C4|nr:DUF547 domain-containing protein [uncultured Psychroserpens sp.]